MVKKIIDYISAVVTCLLNSFKLWAALKSFSLKVKKYRDSQIIIDKKSQRLPKKIKIKITKEELQKIEELQNDNSSIDW